jgi:hypothetical protein
MKRLSAISKLILFLTAYIPLGIICLIIDFEKWSYPFFKHAVYSLILLLLILILPVFLLLLLRHFLTRPSGWESMVVNTAESLDDQILSYIFSYILPFLGFPEGRQVSIALFMLFIVGILYTRSDMIGINPILALFGYHMVKVDWSKGETDPKSKAILIGKGDYYSIRYAGTITAIQIHNELWLAKGGE